MDVRLTRHHVLGLVVGVALAVAADTAWAQQQQQGNRSRFGSAPVGGGSSPRSGTQSGGQGTQQPGQGSGTGTARPGGMGATGQGTGGDFATEFNPFMGSQGIEVPGGFIGRGAEGQPFVGRPGTEQNATGRATTGRARTNTRTRRSTNTFGRGQLGQFGQGGLDADLGRGGSRSGRAAVRMRVIYRPVFSTALSVTPASTQRISDSLTESPTFAAATGLSVETEDDVLVLRGQVASEYNRQLAERVARLEPGVFRVRNELTVVGE